MLQEAPFGARRQHAAVMKSYFVYLLANRRHGALYVGVTNDLVRRVDEHREGLADGFTRRYGIKLLVGFDQTTSVEAAIAREKQLKDWKRAWKVAREPRLAGSLSGDPRLSGHPSPEMDCGSSPQ